MTANGRTRSTNRAAIAAAALLLVSVAGSAYAQNFMRSPIGGRPQFSIGPRVNPGIGRAGGNAGGGLDGRLAARRSTARRRRGPAMDRDRACRRPMCVTPPVSLPIAMTARANAPAGRSP